MATAQEEQLVVTDWGRSPEGRGFEVAATEQETGSDEPGSLSGQKRVVAGETERETGNAAVSASDRSRPTRGAVSVEKVVETGLAAVFDVDRWSFAAVVGERACARFGFVGAGWDRSTASFFAGAEATVRAVEFVVQEEVSVGEEEVSEGMVLDVYTRQPGIAGQA